MNKFIRLHQSSNGKEFYLRKYMIQEVRGRSEQGTVVWGHRFGTRIVSEEPQWIIDQCELDWELEE